MKLLPVYCHNCQKIIYREKRRVNEAKKNNWNSYCSIECQSKIKNHQIIVRCSNPNCVRIFKRSSGDVKDKKRIFCSRSCAVSVNNSNFPKRKAFIKICAFCGKDFKSREKYCSTKCMYKDKVITKDKIIKKIKEFYLETDRIPLKREFYHAKSAFIHFNGWNNAIKAAGFNPNPVLFSKKYFAKDGHKCDSFTERIIDDWLYKKGITHTRHVPYPSSKGFTADFVIGNHWIEFFGLYGEIKRYDDLRRQKIQIAKKHHLKLIGIYPKDIFPKNNLSQILTF